MPRVSYTLEQRLFMYDTYVKSGCVRTVRRRFAHKFQDVTIPHRKTIHAIVNKVRQTGSLLDKRRTVSKRRVLTEEKLDEIGARLEHFPQKSLRLIAQETGISKTSARNATILLNLKPNKKAVVHKLQSRDPAAVWRRMEFVNTEPDTDSERFLTSPPGGSHPNNIKTEEEPVLITFPVMRSKSEDADHITDEGQGEEEEEEEEKAKAVRIPQEDTNYISGGGGYHAEEEEEKSDIIPLEDTNCVIGGIAKEGCETAVQKDTDHISEEERKSDGHQQMDRDYVNEGEEEEKMDVLPLCKDSESNEPATCASESTEKAKGQGLLYVCNICNVQYKCEGALRKHKLQLHHILIDVDRLYECKICEKSFASDSTLKRHRITKHIPVDGDSRQQYECEICNRSYCRLFDLLRHKFEIHSLDPKSREKWYKCHICSKSFFRISHLKRHVVVVHAGIRSYTCKVCKKAFANASNLKIHSRVHTGEKPYKCSVCNKSFKQKAALGIHFYVHGGERPFRCELCERSFTDKSTLLTHIRAHYREKPFSCNVCKKSFSRKRSLTSHNRNYHEVGVCSGVGPYTCEFCGKVYTFPLSFRKHINAHSAEKPYVCSVCNKSFHRKSILTSHMLVHTGKKVGKLSSTVKSN